MWFGLHPRSLAATWGIVFTFFSSVYLDVSVQPVPSFVLRLHLSRFLHSEILALTLDCSSTRLIAAYHVLLRLLLPRHPSCALNILTLYFYFFLTANSSLILENCLILFKLTRVEIVLIVKSTNYNFYYYTVSNVHCDNTQRALPIE